MFSSLAILLLFAISALSESHDFRSRFVSRRFSLRISQPIAHLRCTADEPALICSGSLPSVSLAKNYTYPKYGGLKTNDEHIIKLLKKCHYVWSGSGLSGWLIGRMGYERSRTRFQIL